MGRKIAWGVTVGGIVVFASVVLVRRAPREERLPRIPVRRGNEARLSNSDRAASPVKPEVSSRETAPEGSRSVPSEEAFVEVAGARCARRSHRHFWEDLGVLLEARPAVDPEKYRREVMARSAAYLGLDPSQAAAFQGAATLALAEIQDAWTTRDAEVLGLPASLRADERTQMEQGIQERYETAKQRASARLESLLGTTGRHDQFRRNLGEWIDAVR